MIDPLGLLPLAAAAGGGTVDGIAAARLAAAGLTLLRRSAPLVRALHGRRAALLLPTSPAFLTALAASEGRGAVLVNPLAAPLEVAYQLADANAGAVFTVEALAAKLPSDVPRVLLDGLPESARVIVGERTNDVDLRTHAGDALEIEGAADAEGSDEEAVIVYTSAMAGRPLGARLTHRNLLSNARATIEAAALGPSDHSLAILPFSHLFGLVVSGVAPLLAGGRVTTVDRFNPVRVVDALDAGGITMLVGVPSVFAGLLAVLDRRGGGLAAPALRVCICGGAPLPRALEDRWAEVTGVELRQGYGLTEAGPVCLFNRVALPNRRGTLGVPFPGVEVAIRDPATGAPLPAGAEGEICVRGPNVFAGYVAGGEAGLAVRDGWLHTGDLGAEAGGGAIAFRGLIKAMFTRNGFNIYPREIERVVGEMPHVAEARVRAVPEPAKENDIALAVARDGAAELSADDVKRWCAANLSTYKQPGEVEVR
jgi:long-chain acyl-CoA synthetase